MHKSDMDLILESLDEIPKNHLYDNDDYFLTERTIIIDDLVITESQIINEGIMKTVSKWIGGGVGGLFSGLWEGFVEGMKKSVRNLDDPEAAKEIMANPRVMGFLKFMKGYVGSLNGMIEQSKAFLKLDPAGADKIKVILKTAIKEGKAVLSDYKDKLEADLIKEFREGVEEAGKDEEEAPAPAPAAPAAPAAPTAPTPAPAAPATATTPQPTPTPA